MPAEPDWLKKARETHRFHRENQLSHSKKWTIQMTATSLKRSFGSVQIDLLLSKESRIYDLTQFEFALEARNFIAMKKKERELED